MSEAYFQGFSWTIQTVYRIYKPMLRVPNKLIRPDHVGAKYVLKLNFMRLLFLNGLAKLF